MSDNSNAVYTVPANLKSKIWMRFGFYKKEGHLDKSLAVCKVWRTAIKCSDSTTNLETYLVRQREENYAGDKESVDANFSNVTASTSKNMQDDNMAIKGTVCNDLSTLLIQIYVFIHKEVLIGVQLPLPTIWLDEELPIWIYIARSSSMEAAMSFQF